MSNKGSLLNTNFAWERQDGILGLPYITSVILRIDAPLEICFEFTRRLQENGDMLLNIEVQKRPANTFNILVNKSFQRNVPKQYLELYMRSYGIYGDAYLRMEQKLKSHHRAIAEISEGKGWPA